MADSKDPVRQLLDVAVYAPIGLLLLARRELPAWTAAGRERVESQITLARFVGRMAVTRGTQEVKRRLDAAEAARQGTADPSIADIVDAEATEVPSPEDAVSLPDVVVAAVAEAEVERERAAADVTTEAADGPAVLPIEGYDSLAASQVVARLATLIPDELAVIHEHELGHRNRRTILGKIHQLQSR